MQKLFLFLLFCLSLSLGAGCELADTDASSSSPAAPAEGDGSDDTDFNFATATWLGPAYPETTRDERAVLHTASIDRDANQITLSYDPIPSDWHKQVNAPVQLVMFEQLDDGSWRGGRVEWLDPGQTVKSLNNIDNGYNGWQKPPAGATMAVSILSAGGRHCSNTVITTY